MRLTVTGLLLLVLGNATAATVTIDFTGAPDVSGDVSATVQGFEFYSDSGIGISSTNDYRYAFSCPNCDISMRSAGGGSFSLMSAGLLNPAFPGQGDAYVTITGKFASGGEISEQIHLPSVGDVSQFTYMAFDASWTDLTSVTFGGASNGSALLIDDIVVNAVPVPAAVWLFGSALAGLGWMRRRATV